MGFAPSVPHLANLPLAALQRTGLAGDFVGHLMNFPLASRHGAASAGVDSIAIEAAANISLRIIILFLPPSIRLSQVMARDRAGRDPIDRPS